MDEKFLGGTISRRARPCMEFQSDVRRSFINSIVTIFTTFCRALSRHKLSDVAAKVFDDEVDKRITRPVQETELCMTAIAAHKFLTSGFLDSLNGAEDGHHSHPMWYIMRRANLMIRKTAIGRFDRKSVLTIAGSLVSAKKTLPFPCGCIGRDTFEKTVTLLTSAPIALPSDYLPHVRREMRRILRRTSGRIKPYRDYVFEYLPGSGACIGSSRSSGGKRSALNLNRDELMDLHFAGDHVNEFLYGVRGRPERPLVQYELVHARGKSRGVTMNGVDHDVLSPLHKLCYDIISQEPWLLRGEVSAERFSFVYDPNKVIISGDYESATDNLPILVQETALKEVMDYYDIPDSIREYALRSLRTVIRGPDGIEYEQKKGQLMGSLLSFPFLCLQNYFAFTYLVPDHHESGVRINGDDIVWQGTARQMHAWKEGVSNLGLKLSSGKTFVDSRFFSLNSAYFWCSTAITQLPRVNMGLLANDAPEVLDSNLERFTYQLLGRLRENAIRAFFWMKRSLLRKFSIFQLIDRSLRGCSWIQLVGIFRMLGVYGIQSYLFFIYCIDSGRIRESSLASEPEGWMRKELRQVPAWIRERQAEWSARISWESLVPSQSSDRTPENVSAENNLRATVGAGLVFNNAMRMEFILKHAWKSLNRAYRRDQFRYALENLVKPCSNVKKGISYWIPRGLDIAYIEAERSTLEFDGGHHDDIGVGTLGLWYPESSG